MRAIFSHPAVFKELDKIRDEKTYHLCICAILDLMKYPDHNARRLEGGPYYRVLAGGHCIVYRFDNRTVHVAAFILCPATMPLL